MKELWCWRCRQNMPMLDEDEFRIIDDLYAGCMRATKEFREQHNIPLEGVPVHARFAPVRKAYEDLTGMADCHENAIMHHRISIYGPPCVRCGKPLRTPRAKFCAACGEHVKGERGDVADR